MTATRINITAIPPRLRPAMTALAQGAGRLARLIRRDPGRHTDRAAALLFTDLLAEAGLAWHLDHRDAAPREVIAGGDLALAMISLDGADNLEGNGPAGTIFALMPATGTPEASFLRPARQMLAGGYIIYGASCRLMVSFGCGTQHYILDTDSNRFELAAARHLIPGSPTEFAIDAARYRHWPRPVRAYVDDCMAGLDGPRAKSFTMRWTGALVAETHRILMQGGICLCPADRRDNSGGLRLLHQAAPLAMVIEQAGGRATDGALPVLDQSITDLRARTPLVFGSAEKVDRVAAYHDLPEAEVSALFGHRGLFRA